MGKYMKKSKITGDVGVMEVSQPTSMGVRTRAAKTLALQRLNSSSASASASAAPAAIPNTSATSGGSSCYLQLRSRRLEKPPILTEPKKHQQQQRGAKGSKTCVGSVNSGTAGSHSASVFRSCDGDGCFGNYGDFGGSEGNSGNEGFPKTEEGNEAGAEASFGENNLDFEARDRGTRESTPCNFIRDPDTIATPGSSTRQMSRTGTDYRRGRDGTQRIVPTTRELEDFFVYAEQQQQRLFVEKYNFDIVNDLPLSGRYEWVQVVP